MKKILFAIVLLAFLLFMIPFTAQNLSNSVLERTANSQNQKIRSLATGNFGGVVIDFDTITPGTLIGTNYPGITFSNGYTSWDPSGSSYGIVSTPYVAYSGETNNWINFTKPIQTIGAYFSTQFTSNLIWKAVNANNEIVKEVSIPKSTVNNFIVLNASKIFNAVQVTGLTGFNSYWKIDNLEYLTVDSLTQRYPDIVTTQPWKELGPKPIENTNGIGAWGSAPYAGRVTAIAVNKSNQQEVYVGAAQGGVWKTIDGGKYWEPLMDQLDSLAVGSIAISPDTHTLYVGTGEANHGVDNYAGIGVLKSTDEGKTWTVLGANYFSGTSISSIEINPGKQNYILVTNTYGIYAKGLGYNSTAKLGIYLSLDGGLTWTLKQDLTTHNGGAELVVNSSNANIIYASDYYGSIYKTSDGGATWGLYDYISANAADAGRVSIALTPANPNYLYELFANSTGEVIWLGTFDGTTYTRFSDLPLTTSSQYGPCGGQCWYNLLIEVAPNDKNTIYIGTNSLYKSTTAGLSWNFVGGAGVGAYMHPDMHALAIDPNDPSILYSGDDGGIWMSKDTGTTWTSLNTNLGITQFGSISASPTNDNHILGGAQDNACDIYTGSTSWTLAAGGDGAATAFFNDTMMACNYVDLFVRVSTNNGLNFNYRTTGINGGDPSLFNAPMIQDPANPSILYLGSNRVYKTTNFAEQWIDISGVLTTGKISAIAASKSNNQVLLVGDNNGDAHLTTNGGTSWITVFSSTIDISSVAIDPSIEQKIYVTLANQSIFYSVNQGSSWTAIDTTAIKGAVNVIKYNPLTEVPFFGTDYGVYYINQTGYWEQVGTGLPHVAVYDMAFTKSNYLVVGTHGRGAWLNKITPDILLGTKMINGHYKSGEVIDFTIYDGNGYTNASYYWDSNAETTVASGFRKDLTTILPTGDGEHILHVKAKDKTGNWALVNLTFTTDDTAPLFTLTSLANNTDITGITTVGVDVQELSSIINASYVWNAGTNTTVAVTSGSMIIPVGTQTGQQVLQVFAEDELGNRGSSVFVFTISEIVTTTPSQTTTTNPVSGTTSTTPPSSNPLPGYELIVSVMALGLIYKKRMKK